MEYKKLVDLKGIGEKTEKYFNKLGIYVPSDLLYYFPRDYETYEEPKRVFDLEVGKIQTIKVIICDNPVHFRKGKLDIVYVYVDDGTRRIRAYWFNASYMVKRLKKGSVMILRGRLSFTKAGLTITQSKIYDVKSYEALKGKIFPIYPLTKGISNEVIKKSIKTLLENETNVEEYLPKDILEKNDLMEINESIYYIHFPKDFDNLLKARRRLTYNEFFLFSLGILYSKDKTNKKTYEELKNLNIEKLNSIIKKLPYKLTNSQNAVINDIINDFKENNTMNRLLEGDVGSGKTIVAFLIMVLIADKHFQTAIMTPTEVLSNQHYENFIELNEKLNLNLNIGLLTSSIKAKEKKEIYSKLESGEIDCIIGTQSLINDDIKYKNLAFCVIDEQHRFGVNVRNKLQKKGDKVNVLVMSATPIPRTLSLLLYADLSISKLTDKPVGRLPIKNAVITEKDREKGYKAIRKELNLGHQAYVICPSIEASDEEGSFANFQNVVDYTKKLKEYFGKNVRVEMLHGKMKNDEKNEIMQDFKNGNIDILCSTTVIEVGVDVKNATFIMIEDAGNFGLATLHQLRGRVGRGEAQSFALFVDTIGTEKSKERLSVLEKSNDGFFIAEKDLEMRGPGDIFGVKQAGEMEFRLGDIYTDMEVFKNAAFYAKEIIKNDTNLSKKENYLIKCQLDEYVKNSYTI